MIKQLIDNNVNTGHFFFAVIVIDVELLPTTLPDVPFQASLVCGGYSYASGGFRQQLDLIEDPKDI